MSSVVYGSQKVVLNDKEIDFKYRSIEKHVSSDDTRDTPVVDAVSCSLRIHYFLSVLDIASASKLTSSPAAYVVKMNLYVARVGKVFAKKFFSSFFTEGYVITHELVIGNYVALFTRSRKYGLGCDFFIVKGKKVVQVEFKDARIPEEIEDLGTLFNAVKDKTLKLK